MRQFHDLGGYRTSSLRRDQCCPCRAPHGAACVIGVGGGKDIQSAILFGHSPIVGIDVNPIFISLLKNEFRDFVRIAGRKDVKLVVDEARSYLSRSDEKFSVLQMSLIDTWAATGAGAMTLSENALYTVEGWKVLYRPTCGRTACLRSLAGIDPDNLGETGRLLSLAIDGALRKRRNPSGRSSGTRYAGSLSPR